MSMWSFFHFLFSNLFPISFQIEENARVLSQLGQAAASTSSLSSEEGTPVTKKPKSAALEKFKLGAKKAMLIWAQKAVTK